MGDPETFSCREWQQENYMQTGWREDVLRRAEASMERRREGERDAVHKMIALDQQRELEREKFAWRVMASVIAAGFALALALRLIGVAR
jgi:hypothetical protein